MDRFIDTIEWLAAAFVGIVALDIFVSVLLRYFFAVSIPDSYDFGKLLLGILIFWGIAATSYRGGHITVDLLWSAVGPRGKRAIDVFATLVLLVRRDGADNHAVRQSASDLPGQRADLRSAHSDLAVRFGGMAGRCVRGAADRDPHLPAGGLPTERGGAGRVDGILK
jgi:hypothetical protein